MADPDTACQMGTRGHVNCVAQLAIVVDRSAGVDDDAHTERHVRIHNRAGHDHGSVPHSDVTCDGRARVTCACKGKSPADEIGTHVSAGGIVAKRQNNVVNSVCHKLVESLPPSENRRVTEALPLPVQVDVIEKSDDFVFGGAADNVSNHPGMSTGAPDDKRSSHRAEDTMGAARRIRQGDISKTQ
jgi:hypothetical protein